MTQAHSLKQHLADVMGKVGYVQKHGKNEFHKYRYARAEDIFRKVNDELSKRGICVSSHVALAYHEPGHAIVHTTLTFLKGDESVTVQGLGEGSDKGDKAVMKASTAALKYALASAFLISWGDDPEADVETDKAVSVFEAALNKINAASIKEELERLVPELESLTSKKAITPGQASKLRKSFIEKLKVFEKELV